jgi:hypothetical protein
VKGENNQVEILCLKIQKTELASKAKKKGGG